LEENNA